MVLCIFMVSCKYIIYVYLDLSIAMNNLYTKVDWIINSYCKSDCSYCPIELKGANLPKEIKEYLHIARVLIEHYSSLSRLINWRIDGGEPLDMNDIVTLLKFCREQGNSIELCTNGGKLWIDWWAIEPYVDRLNLTYHYWQNPNLIKYIIDTFVGKNKPININVPIRHDHFDEDLERALAIQRNHKIVVGKHQLYHKARQDMGSHPYTNDQISIMKGVKIVEPIETKPINWEIQKKVYQQAPSFNGMMCMYGIEYLHINQDGWVKGGHCNNIYLGNIWHVDWKPPFSAAKCGMTNCLDPFDQTITKF